MVLRGRRSLEPMSEEALERKIASRFARQQKKVEDKVQCLEEFLTISDHPVVKNVVETKILSLRDPNNKEILSRLQSPLSTKNLPEKSVSTPPYLQKRMDIFKQRIQLHKLSPSNQQQISPSLLPTQDFLINTVKKPLCGRLNRSPLDPVFAQLFEDDCSSNRDENESLATDDSLMDHQIMREEPKRKRRKTVSDCSEISAEIDNGFYVAEPLVPSRIRNGKDRTRRKSNRKSTSKNLFLLSSGSTNDNVFRHSDENRTPLDDQIGDCEIMSVKETNEFCFLTEWSNHLTSQKASLTNVPECSNEIPDSFQFVTAAAAELNTASCQTESEVSQSLKATISMEDDLTPVKKMSHKTKKRRVAKPQMLASQNLFSPAVIPDFDVFEEPTRKKCLPKETRMLMANRPNVIKLSQLNASQLPSAEPVISLSQWGNEQVPISLSKLGNKTDLETRPDVPIITDCEKNPESVEEVAEKENVDLPVETKQSSDKLDGFSIRNAKPRSTKRSNSRQKGKEVCPKGESSQMENDHRQEGNVETVVLESSGVEKQEEVLKQAETGVAELDVEMIELVVFENRHHVGRVTRSRSRENKNKQSEVEGTNGGDRWLASKQKKKKKQTEIKQSKSELGDANINVTIFSHPPPSNDQKTQLNVFTSSNNLSNPRSEKLSKVSPGDKHLSPIESEVMATNSSKSGSVFAVRASIDGVRFEKKSAAPKRKRSRNQEGEQKVATMKSVGGTSANMIIQSTSLSQRQQEVLSEALTILDAEVIGKNAKQEKSMEVSTKRRRGILNPLLEAGNAARDAGRSLEGVTHLVCGDPTKRTLSVLYAIARGCWLLSFDWVTESVAQGKWLPEREFEITSFPGARKNRERLGILKLDALHHCKVRHAPSSEIVVRPPRILSCNCLLHVLDNTSPPRHELMTLIALAGGWLVDNIEHAKYVIGSRDQLKMTGSKGKKMKGRNFSSVPLVKETWVLDSVASGEQKDIANYFVD